ncbi:MAG: bile acid:sodium symporter family protein [Planctomycetaceae bacterium]
MREFWHKHWFLTVLALMIAGGMTLGGLGYEPALAPVFDHVNPRWTTACVLFLMSFSLAGEHLWRAFRAPGPVLLGCAVNYGLIPLLAWGLMPWQQHVDLRLGLMIAASVPCTTAAASVLTRKARGDDAVSLLITLATNVSCFLLTPLWLRLTTASRVELDVRRLMLDLVLAVLVPTVAGQLCRLPAVFRAPAIRHKSSIGIVAQVLIELLVLTAALRAGTALYKMRLGAATATGGAEQAITASGIAGVWLSSVGVHLAGLAAGWWLARRGGQSRAAAVAVALAGSQKTLPIGLYIATDPALFGATHPFAMFPMLLYHASQLFLDTWLASRMAATASEG